MIWPEVAWLAVILVVPLFFSVYAVAPFEAAKAHMVVSVTAASIVWLTASAIHRIIRNSYCVRKVSWLQIADCRSWITDCGLRDTPHASHLRRLTLGAMFALALATVAATLTSVDPVRSLTGAPYRGQGALFTLIGIAFAFSIVAGVQSRRQVNRIVLALLAPSIPVVVYALLQAGGWDFYPWRLEAGAASYRVFSTLGHPSFLAVYLVMIVPLTAAEAVRCLSGGHAPGNGGRQTGLFSGRRPAVVSGRTADSAIGLLLLLLLAGQVTTLLWTERRAGLLGLLAAGLTFALLSTRFWLPRQKVGAGAIILLLAALILTGASDAPTAGRLADLRSDPYGTATQRVLVWETAGRLLRENPTRLVTGFGPSTLDLVMAGHRPPALDELVGDAPFDHTHGAAWEALTTTGLFGLLAYFGLVFTVLAQGLMAMGLLPDGRAIRRLLLASACGAVLGAAALALTAGSWTLALPGGLLGAIAGLLGAALLLPATVGAHREAPADRMIMVDDARRVEKGTALRVTDPFPGPSPWRGREICFSPRNRGEKGAGGLRGVRSADPIFTPGDARQLLRLVALLSALVGYLVVSQFNVPDVTTTLLFWILVPLVVVLGGEQPPARDDEGPAVGEGWPLVALGAAIPLTLLFDLSGLIGTNPAPIWPAIALLAAGGVGAVLFVAGARTGTATAPLASSSVRASTVHGGWSTGRP